MDKSDKSTMFLCNFGQGYSNNTKIGGSGGDGVGGRNTKMRTLLMMNDNFSYFHFSWNTSSTFTSTLTMWSDLIVLNSPLSNL